MTLKRSLNDVNDDDDGHHHYNQGPSSTLKTFDSPSKRQRNNVQLLQQFPSYLVKINPFTSMTMHRNESKSVQIMGALICHQCNSRVIGHIKCDFCDHIICHDCQQLCLKCHRYFCGLCSIKTYDYSNECTNVAICFNCNQ
ncbi:uncharacterized protein LOC124495483 [Dermatophagoides farinae]|uniref:Apoptosis regulatory protein Siva n=1 Tax=Dermatophagoides farinae TaxID=6954 RepID=A0A922I4X8_DERFA|nr:uncharacterized protein LOC124495483 [Dermatophagoides farinae]KAH7640396.1 hypothetical protein HUG17_7863 [Dermatophagoides farinae]KAH9521293.1 hypothetical protein DERF_004962 [Dermatophagoides farinae]